MLGEASWDGLAAIVSDCLDGCCCFASLLSEIKPALQPALIRSSQTAPPVPLTHISKLVIAASISLPLSMSSLTTSAWPSVAAQKRASPLRPVACMSAPLSSRTRTVSICPFAAAYIKGVKADDAGSFMSYFPLSKSSMTALVSPLDDAVCNGPTHPASKTKIARSKIYAINFFKTSLAHNLVS